MQVTDKVYRSLKPMERLRACVSALARGDREEADRLVDTCQEKLYRMPDMDFGYPLRTLGHLVTSHERALYRASLGVVLGSLMAKLQDEEGKGEESASRLTEASGQILLAQRVAWSRFCDEIGIPEKELEECFFHHDDDPLGMVLRAADELASNGALDDGELDIEQVEQSYLARLREGWKLCV